MNGVPEAIEAVWKNESTRLIAAIARVKRHIGVAEELAATHSSPSKASPNPGAWLMTAAKRRAIDGFRRSKMLGLNVWPQILRD